MQQISWFASGNMTFAEAYKKTGRVLCITLSAVTKKAPPVLLNYVTAPNVTIGSAVCASAAVPGFVKAMRLQIKDENGKVHMQEEVRRMKGKEAMEAKRTSPEPPLAPMFLLLTQPFPKLTSLIAISTEQGSALLRR
jgi:hypothetical protein